MLYHWTIFLSINSLKLECEKLASEKTEMQRHYVMVSFKNILDCFVLSWLLMYHFVPYLSVFLIVCEWYIMD